MIVHNFDPVMVDLGIFQIRWYSIAYILGILLGWLYALKIIQLSNINKFNFKQITKSDFEDLIIYLVLGIIFGGVVLLGKINLNEKKPTDEANIVMPMPVTCCDAPR